MIKKITIKQDASCEMMEILIDGETFHMGNYWDFSMQDWIDLIKKTGVKVEMKKYKYKD